MRRLAAIVPALLLLAAQDPAQEAHDLRPQAAPGQTYVVHTNVVAHLVLEREDRGGAAPYRAERRMDRSEDYSVTIDAAAGGRPTRLTARCTLATLDVQASDVQAVGPRPQPHQGRSFSVRFDAAPPVLNEDGTPASDVTHVGRWEDCLNLLPAGAVRVGETWDVPASRLGWIAALVGDRDAQDARLEGNLTCTLDEFQSSGARIHVVGRVTLGIDGSSRQGDEGTGTLDFDAQFVFNAATGRPVGIAWSVPARGFRIERPLVEFERAVDQQEDVPVRAGMIRISAEELHGQVRFE